MMVAVIRERYAFARLRAIKTLIRYRYHFRMPAVMLHADAASPTQAMLICHAAAQDNADPATRTRDSASRCCRHAIARPRGAKMTTAYADMVLPPDAERLRFFDAGA